MNQNELIRIRFEESKTVQSLIEDVDMCEDCEDAVATTLRGYGVGVEE